MHSNLCEPGIEGIKDSEESVQCMLGLKAWELLADEDDQAGKHRTS